jgi:multidrug efflux pump subunit AcrA (membrane-fusion protein)
VTTATTERRRWPRRGIRAVAWTSAGSAFLTGLGILGRAPTPPSARAVTPVAAGRKVIVRRIIKRVVILTPTKAPVRYVAAPVTSTTTTGSTPPPAPTTTSGGSHP